MSADLFASAPVPARKIVRVALPLPVDSLFDYAVPDELARAALPGCRVRVRAGSRTYTGVIVEEASQPPEGRLRDLEAVLDEEPVLAPRLLGVLQEEAEQLLCPLGVALAAAIPAGSSPRTRRLLAITPRGREARSRGALRGPAASLLECLEAGPRTPASLRARLGPEALEPVADLLRDGLLAETTGVTSPAVRAAVVRVLSAAPDLDPAAARERLRRAPSQLALLEILVAEGPTEWSRLSGRVKDLPGRVRRLQEHGFVRVEERTPGLGESPLPESGEVPELTPDQERAVEALETAIDAGDPTPILLHGVTGSGKTEVYLRAVAHALARGRQALVLVPEITLTHQIVARLRARFGDQLAVLHSGLRPGERLAQWERLRRGETPIAVGARSALFAPTRDLGLIVIDEEHDGAYKNEEGFRYHARSLGARRARADGCPLLLGSATPALETRYAAERGVIGRLRLPRRIGGRPLPSVELIDLARERASLPRGRKLILGSALRRALVRGVDEGSQSLLFLNRRGFSTQIACFDCQHVVRCNHCDISLTFHAETDRLCCHYCDYRIRPPAKCPGCGSDSVALLGLGTERVEEEVRAALPGARVARLDRDVSARRGATEEILSRLRAGDIDVLVGTQMIAKGHDFPGVGLVGVVNADLGLHFPDFRAAERTFQLLTQVSGRAGRGGLPGRVLIQTYQPDHPAIAPVVDHDYERFYLGERDLRHRLGYPPFGRVALVRVSGSDEGLAHLSAERLAKAGREALSRLETEGAAGGEVLGPAPAPIARLRGRYRFQVLVKQRRLEPLRRVGRAVLEACANLPGDVRASLDLQPQDML